MEDEMKKVKIELKKKRLKEWFHEKKVSAAKFYYKHEEEIKFYAPIVIPAGFAAIKGVSKARMSKREERAKELYHWDPRRGTYYMSRRPLKSSELLELDRLYSLGYTKGEALKKMKLLK